MFWVFIFTLFVYKAIRIICRDDEAKSTYIPNPNGHWKNRGTDWDERWEWYEPEEEPILLYVSVLESIDGYRVVIDTQPSVNEIESMDCDCIRIAEVALQLFRDHYAKLGLVTVCDKTGLFEERIIKNWR